MNKKKHFIQIASVILTFHSLYCTIINKTKTKPKKKHNQLRATVSVRGCIMCTCKITSEWREIKVQVINQSWEMNAAVYEP